MKSAKSFVQDNINTCQIPVQEQQCPVSSGFIHKSALERAQESDGEQSKQIHPSPRTLTERFPSPPSSLTE